MASYYAFLVKLDIGRLKICLLILAWGSFNKIERFLVNVRSEMILFFIVMLFSGVRVSFLTGRSVGDCATLVSPLQILIRRRAIIFKARSAVEWLVLRHIFPIARLVNRMILTSEGWFNILLARRWFCYLFSLFAGIWLFTEELALFLFRWSVVRNRAVDEGHVASVALMVIENTK